MKAAIITGASSGIGEAFLKQYTADVKAGREQAPDEIWVVARSADKLAKLKETYADFRLRAVTADLGELEELKKIEALLAETKPEAVLLINCAGMGKRGDVMSRGYEDLADTIDINCRALSVLTRICLPYMKEGSRIINIASSAAFLPQPGFACYAASKAYVVDFSRALRNELRKSKISVTAICPGPVKTAFLGKATDNKETEFTGIRKNFVADPDKLAASSLKASRKGRTLYVYKFSQKLLHFASKILPTAFILKLESLLM